MEGIEKLGSQIETLTRAATEKQAPKPVEIRGEPPHVTWLYDFKVGGIGRYVAEPPPRRYQAGGMKAVVSLVNEFVARPADKPAGTSGATSDAPRTVMVFVQAGSIVAILDEKGDRRERVVMGFQRSPAFSQVVALGEESAEALDQRDFINLLRTDIAGKYVPDNIIATIRRIKFSSSSEGDSSVQTGKQSMGKRVEAEIAGLDGTAMDLLETVLITVPVYSDLLHEQSKPVNATVECHLDIDLAEQTFRLRPKAGEIERVLLETDLRIMDDLGFDAKPTAPTASDSTPTTGRVLIVRGVPN